MREEGRQEVNITVTREPDPLTRWEWDFWYYDRRHALVLDRYRTLTRATKRHKFRVTEQYNRIDTHRNGLTENDVVIDADVDEEARRRFTKDLKVQLWGECK